MFVRVRGVDCGWNGQRSGQDSFVHVWYRLGVFDARTHAPPPFPFLQPHQSTQKNRVLTEERDAPDLAAEGVVRHAHDGVSVQHRVLGGGQRHIVLQGAKPLRLFVFWVCGRVWVGGWGLGVMVGFGVVCGRGSGFVCGGWGF